MTMMTVVGETMMTALQSSLSTIAGLSALTWFLIGGIAGGVCLLVVIAVIVVLLVRRRRRRHHRRHRQVDDHVASEGASLPTERNGTDYFGGETSSNALHTPPSLRLGASVNHERGDTALKNTVKKPTSEYGAVSTLAEV